MPPLNLLRVRVSFPSFPLFLFSLLFAGSNEISVYLLTIERFPCLLSYRKVIEINVIKCHPRRDTCIRSYIYLFLGPFFISVFVYNCCSCSFFLSASILRISRSLFKGEGCVNGYIYVNFNLFGHDGYI
jgi:hypothetical protein